MVVFVIRRHAIFWKDRVEINNNVLHGIWRILTRIADRREHRQALPLTDVWVEIATGGDGGIRRNHSQQLLDMLFATAWRMIGPEVVQEWGRNYKIQPGHHRNPGKHHPLQARDRSTFRKRYHALAETLPLHSSPTCQCSAFCHKEGREASVYR